MENQSAGSNSFRESDGLILIQSITLDDIGRIKQIPQAGEAGIKESLNSCESSPTSSEQRIDSK